MIAQQTGSDILWFLYESDGTRVGFTYNGASYYYTKNAQGDVTGITDSNANLVVEYSYDAWGKMLSTTGSMADTIGKTNPFLYRGYYYDSESGLYYLNSRYYDPQTGRFVSEDSQFNPDTGLIGNNLFAYCNNDPISMTDDEGSRPIFSDSLMTETQEERTASFATMNQRVSVNASKGSNIMYSKKQTARPDSGLQGLSDQEISEKARDKSLSGADRRRYQTEEKLRGLRNKQKRQSNITLEIPDVAKPIIAGGAAIGTGYVVYRVIRLLPSLAPPLWWTLPINVATP